MKKIIARWKNINLLEENNKYYLQDDNKEILVDKIDMRSLKDNCGYIQHISEVANLEIKDEIFKIHPDDEISNYNNRLGSIFDENNNMLHVVSRYDALHVYNTKYTPLLLQLINKCIAFNKELYVHFENEVIKVDGNYWELALIETGIPY